MSWVCSRPIFGSGVTQTKKVILPSLKKYLSCRTNESSVASCIPAGVSLPPEIVARWGKGAPRAVGDITSGFENMESKETMETPLALDRVGELQISSLTQGVKPVGDVMRRDILMSGRTRWTHTRAFLEAALSASSHAFITLFLCCLFAKICALSSVLSLRTNVFHALLKLK